MEAISINIETTDDALKIWLMVKLDVKALVKKHLVLILSIILNYNICLMHTLS